MHYNCDFSLSYSDTNKWTSMEQIQMQAKQQVWLKKHNFPLLHTKKKTRAQASIGITYIPLKGISFSFSFSLCLCYLLLSSYYAAKKSCLQFCYLKYLRSYFYWWCKSMMDDGSAERRGNFIGDDQVAPPPPSLSAGETTDIHNSDATHDQVWAIYSILYIY